MNTNTEEFQNVLKWGKIVLIVLAVFLAGEAIGVLKGLGDSSPVHNTISVSGEGEAVAIPDIATFSFSVSAEGKEVSEAQAQVTEKMNAIIAALKNMGIEEKDISTSNYSAYPKYVSEASVCTPTYCPPSRGSVQDGYTVSHNISVKVRNTQDAGKALSLVGEMGATGLSGISFTVDDRDAIIAEARAEAIANAKEKAEILADNLDVRLGKVISYYDDFGATPYYDYAEQGFGGDGTVRANVAPTPDLPTGESKVVVRVNVIYEIR